MNKDKKLLLGEERQPNRWNTFQGVHSGLSKSECSKLYRQIITSESGRKQSKKTYTRCNLDKFRQILAALPDNKRKVIEDTPFVSLLELDKEGVSQIDAVIKTLVRHFICDRMTLVCKGFETQEFVITPEDFSTIMGIKNGSGPVVENAKLDVDLVTKFCKLEKNGKYKDICPNKIQSVLMDYNEKDEIAIKQAFSLAAMHFIVCTTARGKLGKKMLYYVQNVNNLTEQPWVTLAMEALKCGIKTYQEGKGAQRSLGGCVLFLQLYCMWLTLAEIDEKVTQEFSINWMNDYARGNVMKRNNKKLLVDRVRKNLKTISNRIKDESETIDLQLVLDLNSFTDKYLNKIPASVCIGPFRIRTSMAIDARAKRIIQWVYNEDPDKKNEAELVVSSDGGIAISKSDMTSSLNLRSWLSETIINFVSEYLCARALPNPKYWYFPTHFEKATRVANGQGVKKACEGQKWAQADSVGMNLRDVEQFFVPVLDDDKQHLNLVVVNMKKKTLEVWDTLNKNKNGREFADLLARVGVGLEEFLEWETGSILKFKTSSGDVRQQEDEEDCGVYVCHFMEYPHQVYNKAYEWHSAEERCHLAVRILTAKENCSLPHLEEMSSDSAIENISAPIVNEELSHSAPIQEEMSSDSAIENISSPIVNDELSVSALIREEMSSDSEIENISAPIVNEGLSVSALIRKLKRVVQVLERRLEGKHQ